MTTTKIPLILIFFHSKVDCAETDPFVLDSEQQLGRIEVFNSLAVIAPQIELDRLRSDRRFNVTGMSLISIILFILINFEFLYISYF